ncbi:MAG: helix-turn-helix domain-containing protein [Deltaproteobacteria bacterium]|nr:helix-turn-helix domain-containing protein [Deltaproteobacteria bacterium]
MTIGDDIQVITWPPSTLVSTRPIAEQSLPLLLPGGVVAVAGIVRTERESSGGSATEAADCEHCDAREIMTVEDVSELLRVPSRTVESMARAGRIPAKKIGRDWRFLREEVIAWLRVGDRRGASRKRRAGVDRGQQARPVVDHTIQVQRQRRRADVLPPYDWSRHQERG